MDIIKEYSMYVNSMFEAPHIVRHGNAKRFGEAYIGSNRYRKNRIKRKRANKK